MIHIAPVLIASLILAADFKVPGPEERVSAIGDTQRLPPALRQALTPGADFDPITLPGPRDWLSAHPERRQTFQDFAATRKNVPTRTRKRIYRGSFPPDSGPSLERLREFATIFFAPRRGRAR